MSRAGWFLAELKRRRVYHVGVAYAVVAFVVWQVADIAVPALGLPDSAVTLTLVLTILGFPIALVLAWAYELRPDGVHPESTATGTGASNARTVETGASNVEGPVSLRVGRADLPIPDDRMPPWGDPGPDAGPSSADRVPSVAVLPFANLAAESGGEFFSDGVTEEITHVLARSPGLRVVARTSAFAFRERAADIRDVARQLGVSHLLEGSVRRSGDRLRITVQLIEAAEGTHVWSERYDRRLDDVFAIQDEIAAHIAARLTGELGASVTGVRAAANVEAYDAYLRGREGHARFAPETLTAAIESYREAIELDPAFAPAHAALAEAYTGQAIGLGIPSEDTMPLARQAAERALALGPELADAHLARALVALFYEWEFDRAKAGIDRAIELRPNDASAHLWDEFYWTYVRRRYEEAVAATRRAQRLDPLDTTVQVRLGTVYFLFGRAETAVSFLEGQLASDPESGLLHMALGDALGRTGDLAAALETSQRAVDLFGGVERAPNGPLGVLGGYAGLTGDSGRVDRVLEEFVVRSARGVVTAFWEANVRGADGDMDGAFRCFERAYEQRDAALLYLNSPPPAVGFHEDRRFDGLRRRIGLPRIDPR